MLFIETNITGAYIIEPEPYVDSRGSFARTFCAREFQNRGLATAYVQCSVSLNHQRGTLRGLHYQRPPGCEAKLVRCTKGSIYDVIVDLRNESPTFQQHLAVELNAQNRRALYVPEMTAHGFQTLEDETEVFYQMNEFYAPHLSMGVRFDDPKLAVRWPLPASVVSPKDQAWPLLA